MRTWRGPDRYPEASFLGGPHQRGRFSPLGVVLHYTGGGSLISAMDHLATTGLGYHFLIDRDGRVIQQYSTTHKAWHCRGQWMGRSTNHNFLGIALVSWGKLKRNRGLYYAWPNNWTKLIPGASVPWDRCGIKQEESLITLLKWLAKYGIDPINIVGHEEINPSKSDPGGVLNSNLADLRYTIREYLRNIENLSSV